MEKCREQRQNLHIAFIDFTKAFDCVNRELLFKILGKLGCPANFVQVIRMLYSDVHARLCNDGELSNPIEYNSGVKQGCKLAPTLFGMYAAVMLYLAFKDVNPCYSIKVRFRYDGDLFDLSLNDQDFHQIYSRSPVCRRYCHIHQRWHCATVSVIRIQQPVTENGSHDQHQENRNHECR